jgi:hypothetical protein
MLRARRTESRIQLRWLLLPLALCTLPRHSLAFGARKLCTLPSRAQAAPLPARADADTLVLLCDTTIAAGDAQRTVPTAGPACLGHIEGSLVVGPRLRPAAEEQARSRPRPADPLLIALEARLRLALRPLPLSRSPAALADSGDLPSPGRPRAAAHRAEAWSLTGRPCARHAPRGPPSALAIVSWV